MSKDDTKPTKVVRQEEDKYVVRFPDGMRDRIKAAAEANNRSMNAEIVNRLEASLDAELPKAQHVNFSSPAAYDRQVDDLLSPFSLEYRLKVEAMLRTAMEIVRLSDMQKKDGGDAD